MSPDDVAVEEIAQRVARLVGARAPGHCIRVPDLPPDLADRACGRASQLIHAPDVVCLVTPVPTRPWHSEPTKVVELRNASERDPSPGRLVIFVPAGQRVAAEDSFGRTTFEIASFTDIYAHVVDRLKRELERKDPGVADLAGEVIEAARHEGAELDDRRVADYLAAVGASPTAASVGAQLPLLGLVPDVSLGELNEADRGRRLIMNARQMSVLSDLSPPPERVRKIPLDTSDREDREILRALLDSVADGTVDRFEIARRLGRDDVRDRVDFARWRLELVSVVIDELSVTGLIGDFETSTEPIVKKANASIGIKFRCRPAPSNIVGLEELRLEVVRLGASGDELLETGADAVKKRRSLPRTTTPQWRLRVAIGDRDGGLDEGLYRLRIRALSAEGFELKSDVSEVFRVGDVADEEPPIEVAPTLEAAMSAASASGAPAYVLATPKVTVGTPPGPAGRQVLSVAIRFEEVSKVWELRFPSLPARLEAWTIEDPDSLGRYRLKIGSTDIEGPVPAETDVDESFMRARRALFSQLAASQFELSGDVGFGPSVVLSDLASLAESIGVYINAWKSALESATDDAMRTALLGIDQVIIQGDRQTPELRLLAPTHPLRIAWLARYRQVVTQWLLHGASAVGEDEAWELHELLRQLPPPDLPRIIMAGRRPMRHLDPLDFVWALWGPPNVTDVEALADRVRRWLGFGRSAVGPVRVEDIVDRVRRYLASHPYVETLILNFVQPGAAALVLDLLLALQQDGSTASLRYVVRLFSAASDLRDLGLALDDFMADPEAARSVNRDAADAFLASGEDILAPKLTYSKHAIDTLLLIPEAFPAHLTFFLDWFPLRIVPAALASDRRSAYAAGLLIDPVIIFRPGDNQASPQWDEQVAVDDQEDDLIGAYASCQRSTAASLGAEGGSDVPTTRLDLDRVSRTILDVVHRSSDWVVVIDPVFTDAFLDEPTGKDEVPRFLLDYVAPSLIGGNRHILVSSRLREELTSLLRPTAARYGLAIPEEQEDLLLSGLQLLGSGLALRLLHNRTRAAEALSLALASLYLADKGVLRHALVIPLDLHQDLFREARLGASDVGLQRSDLAIVQIDPSRRHFGLHLVEVKARAALPDSIPTELVDHISEQLDNSLEVLRDRLFAANVADRRNSLSAALHVRRLAQVMSRYVDRAMRFGYLDPELADRVRVFLTSLDRSYTIAFRKYALLFELDGDGGPGGRLRDVELSRIGRSEIKAVLERSATPLATRYASSPPERLETVLGAHGAAAASVTIEPVDTPVPPTTPVPDSFGNEEDFADLDVIIALDDGPDPDDVQLLGLAARSRQFGIVGALDTGERVAIDLDGTNVTSVFGVQGSGKSYTVGTIIEAALLRDPHLNRLPSPLAAVVFHYSTDQTYAPEYASMAHPNDDPEAVARLHEAYGASPRGLPDVALLVAEAVRDRRAGEFAPLPVHPLKLAPHELTLNDWKLLMGIEGGDQMYSKAMTTILRKIRGSITLEALRSEVEHSSLNTTQKNIALTRLTFTEAFVADNGGVSHHVVPGRLLIVDLRDELIEQDEALALFMVLLNRFAQVETPDGRAFNKLIVFDEAHKYMNDARLTTSIVETIREMRHRGTTVVIASQNPPSVPREVIELSQIVFAHEFSSPTWLDHIKKVNTAFSDLVPSNLARLSAGQAYVWTSGNDRLRKPQRVIIRPRSTRHGGVTRRATE